MRSIAARSIFLFAVISAFGSASSLAQETGARSLCDEKDLGFLITRPWSKKVMAYTGRTFDGVEPSGDGATIHIDESNGAISYSSPHPAVSRVAGGVVRLQDVDLNQGDAPSVPSLLGMFENYRDQTTGTCGLHRLPIFTIRNDAVSDDIWMRGELIFVTTNLAFGTTRVFWQNEAKDVTYRTLQAFTLTR